MKSKLKIFFFCFVLAWLFPTVTVHAEKTIYTYNYDFWGIERESPDSYRAEVTVMGHSLGIGDFKDPQGLFVRGNLIYICDTGNNRIVVLKKDTEAITVVEEFGEVGGETAATALLGPQDIYAAANGDMYIADTGNQRILHIDAGHRVVKEMRKPEDETVDKLSDFLPVKVVADRSGRTFALAKNYNKGYLVYGSDGIFTGYVGASEVKFNMVDYLWKMVSTKEQRAQLEQFVPTEYNNIALDKDGFIYTTTSVFDENELLKDEAKPIRKLNSMGVDILIKNGWYPPIGDISWGNAGGVTGPSKFVDITALDNDTYYALDRTRGRIFGYDFQGNLLYVFGGLGNKLGYFQLPAAIEHMGHELLVLDSKSAGLTFFSPTEYGSLINQALAEYKRGNYDISSEYWEKVLMMDGNNDLAYIGIGRSLLRQGKYKEAMTYFELKYDDNNYSKAFQLYRKQWIEANIGWIFVLFFLAVLLPAAAGFVRKVKKEVEEI
ncbi:hypothetical protein acsn021_15880 [Anaerocolumna cellulosilytica]|uniref:Uncharacterized protein n=1 Tax=Anaerocolumna cellulosilytica TaxID=433286 RepID=A0A6S6QY69_9FIRM|nr:hypothetical protein [Anaerocolumna cellulosilytica]MBB5197211.1 tetratricopeptide (TPR) repeat protein [Anaerocolumna cellulosilytica]BCJ94019.1 hypothetical protein acsn021_15880 [Anaerocolumna cellulosilytica]